jgi:site-specific DNA recombinase
VAKLHGSFEEVLRSLQPSQPYFDLVKAMFAKAWDSQTERLEETLKAYADKASTLEAEIGRVVDRMIEVTNPRALKAFENRIEELELEKLIAIEKAAKKPAPARPFEEMFELSMRFLANPYECWKIGEANARKIVLRLAFCEPLAYSRKTGCLNTKKATVFKRLEYTNTSYEKMVPPGRLELPRPCEQQILSLPRLPVPPQGLPGAIIATGRWRSRICSVVP